MEVKQGETYPGWEKVVQESTLKYCPLEEIEKISMYFYGGNKTDVSRIDALMAYANNPAIEMYTKMHMRSLVHRLVLKEGMYGPVNRRKNTVNGQLRLKKKENINKLVKEAGDPNLLEILQYEEKMGFSWKTEWEKQLAAIWCKDIQKRVEHMLRY